MADLHLSLADAVPFTDLLRSCFPVLLESLLLLVEGLPFSLFLGSEVESKPERLDDIMLITREQRAFLRFRELLDSPLQLLDLCQFAFTFSSPSTRLSSSCNVPKSSKIRIELFTAPA
jgi:hypothetical protein